MAKRTLFVTGTDTEVGKTLTATTLLVRARQMGLRTLAMKPVAAGAERTPDGLRNEDALSLAAVVTEALDYDQINPVVLEPPIAPHIAATEAGMRLSGQRLVGFCRGLMLRPADLCVIEGAGGWRVPLNDRETFAAVPRELGIPVVLVVSLKLGCINHALLTAEAIRRDGLTLAGWVGNHSQPTAMARETENIDYLRCHLGAPCLGILPWQDSPDYEDLAQHLDLTHLGFD